MAARNEPEILDQDMTKADLIYALEHLRFAGFGQRRTIEIDKSVRDYWVSPLRRKA